MSKINWAKLGFAAAGILMTVGSIVLQSWIGQHGTLIMVPIAATTLFFFFMAARETESFRILWSAVVPAPKPRGASPKEALKAKVLQLGNDLFAFLRDKGPVPHPKMSTDNAATKIVAAATDAKLSYIEAIHYGYQGRFRQRMIDLFNELAEHGIQDKEIRPWEITAPGVQNAETIRKLAEHLFYIAAQIEIAEQEGKLGASSEN